MGLSPGGHLWIRCVSSCKVWPPQELRTLWPGLQGLASATHGPHPTKLTWLLGQILVPSSWIAMAKAESRWLTGPQSPVLGVVFFDIYWMVELKYVISTPKKYNMNSNTNSKMTRLWWMCPSLQKDEASHHWFLPLFRGIFRPPQTPRFLTSFDPGWNHSLLSYLKSSEINGSTKKKWFLISS